MKHQVEFFKSMGITVEFTGEDQMDEEAKKAVKKAGIIAKLVWGLHF